MTSIGRRREKVKGTNIHCSRALAVVFKLRAKKTNKQASKQAEVPYGISLAKLYNLELLLIGSELLIRIGEIPTANTQVAIP